MPRNVGAFCSWITSDDGGLRDRIEEAAGFAGQTRLPHHAAALGYGAAAGLLQPEEADLLREKLDHLGGRAFFTKGRPLRFEIDGVALLGVALGAAVDDNQHPDWLKSLLTRSATELAADVWQSGLVTAARVVGGQTGLRITPPDLSVALAGKGIGATQASDLEAGWTLVASLEPHGSGPARDAVQLADFDHIVASRGQIAINAVTHEDLVRLLEGVSRSMRLWRFEDKPRTTKSKLARWEMENEYHVQSLLWSVLAPVFHDLEDEENLASIGHKNPRADLGIPSLRTIIEVKYMRNVGQLACAQITEEIAADASLYLSKEIAYDNIVAFVWDDAAQTEEYGELKQGLEAINGVSAAVILPRPFKMKR